MTLLLALYLAFTDPPTEVEARLFREAVRPSYLTSEGAAWHIIAARAAGKVHRIRPELLLAIAHHESRYLVTVRTREPGHRVSCGVMTPIPKKRCVATDFLLFHGYDTGAAHLREWLDHCEQNERCGLLSYAGGSGLVRVCARYGRWMTKRGTNACNLAFQHRRLAREIQHARKAASRIDL